MFKNINLEKALRENREEVEGKVGQEILDETFEQLYADYCQERRIQSSLENGATNSSEFSWASLEPDRIFSLQEIRKTAIQYRLRFLDSEKFKDEIPYEALMNIKQLEKNVGSELSEFKILAPDDKFRLEDCDKDPLLFLKMSDKYYYLIHQWGNDLAWYRKLAMWPLRSFTTLGISIGAVSLALSMLVPTDIVGIANSHEIYARMAFFVWCLVCITSIVTYVGFAFFKNVTVNQWDSPFFKQEF